MQDVICHKQKLVGKEYYSTTELRKRERERDYLERDLERFRDRDSSIQKIIFYGIHTAYCYSFVNF